MEYLETLTTLVDEGQQVDVLYLDFRKAFDVVSKERLLAKMVSIGVRGKVLAWVREWLSGRSCAQWKRVWAGGGQVSIKRGGDDH